jgi:hypothetical protein
MLEQPKSVEISRVSAFDDIAGCCDETERAAAGHPVGLVVDLMGMQRHQLRNIAASHARRAITVYQPECAGQATAAVWTPHGPTDPDDGARAGRARLGRDAGRVCGTGLAARDKQRLPRLERMPLDGEGTR